MEVFEGDDLELVVVLKNENNKLSADITFVTQIIDPRGIVSAIQESRSVISPTNEAIRLVNHWKTEKDGVYYVEAFVLADSQSPSDSHGFYPLSEKSATDVPVRSKAHANSHNLQIEIRVDNPENVPAGSMLKGSVELVNYANYSEFIRIQPDSSIDLWRKDIPRSPVIVRGCDFWPEGRLDYADAFELPAHGRVRLNEGDAITIPYNLDHVDNYELLWHVNLLVEEPNGVNCIYLSSDVVSFNVTAPTYQELSLVLYTDKQTYNRNDTIRFEAFIENDSDEPFQLATEEIEIHLQDKDGRNLLWSSWGVFDRTPKIVSPHTNYTLDHLSYPDAPWFWDWDQRNYTSEGIPFAVDPGEYLVYATFSSPPMKSKALSIVIQ